MNKICSILNCNNPAICRGWCEKHYGRWKAHGDPVFTKYPTLDKTPEQAFWDRVNRTEDVNECWEWMAKARHDWGYGILSFRGKIRRAHRIAYSLTYGEIPKGMFVCHKCDNPPCCNPNHLYLGEPKQNTADMYKRSREGRKRANGEHNGNSKLTEKQVKEIRNLIDNGVSPIKIARIMNVHRSTIYRIKKGHNWKHI